MQPQGEQSKLLEHPESEQPVQPQGVQPVSTEVQKPDVAGKGGENPSVPQSAATGTTKPHHMALEQLCIESRCGCLFLVCVAA